MARSFSMATDDTVPKWKQRTIFMLAAFNRLNISIWNHLKPFEILTSFRTEWKPKRKFDAKTFASNWWRIYYITHLQMWMVEGLQTVGQTHWYRIPLTFHVQWLTMCVHFARNAIDGKNMKKISHAEPHTQIALNSQSIGNLSMLSIK